MGIAQTQYRRCGADCCITVDPAGLAAVGIGDDSPDVPC